MNWQPIETAPRDGIWILLCGGSPNDDTCYGDEGRRPAVGQWTTKCNGHEVEGHWQHCWYDGGYYGEYENPTHWQPLPEPPA